MTPAQVREMLMNTGIPEAFADIVIGSIQEHTRKAVAEDLRRARCTCQGLGYCLLHLQRNANRDDSE